MNKAYQVTYDVRNVKTNLLTSNTKVFYSFSEATNFYRAIRNMRKGDSETYGTPTLETINA